MIRVMGSDEIRLVARAVRAAGSDRRIVNDMAREIRRGIPPIRTAIRSHVTAVLPSGLAVWVNRARIIGDIKRSEKTAGVSIRVGRNSQTGKRSDLKRLDSAGRIRHMSWGNPPWHPQTVIPNSITDGITDEGTEQLHHAVVVAADNAARVILYG